MKILNIAFANFIHFFYPTYCLHCEDKVERASYLLCLSCFQQIEWIDRKERCPRCHGPKRCKNCFPLHPHRSLFEPYGPITDLYREFIKTKRGKILASFIVIALAKMSWTLPEIIIPLIKSPFPKQEPMWNLVKELGGFLRVPFVLPHTLIQDKSILLLTDQLWNTKDLIEEKRILAQFFPKKVFTIALIDRRC